MVLRSNDSPPLPVDPMTIPEPPSDKGSELITLDAQFEDPSWRPEAIPGTDGDPPASMFGKRMLEIMPSHQKRHSDSASPSVFDRARSASLGAPQIALRASTTPGGVHAHASPKEIEEMRRANTAPEGEAKLHRLPMRSQSIRFIGRAVPNMGRFLQIASRAFTGQPMFDFQCKVCLEECDSRNRINFDGCCAKEQHAVCRDCAVCYLSGRVEEKRVNDLRCPLYGTDGCQAIAKDSELKAYLPKEVYEKYIRFCKMSKDQTLRECPVCSELVKPFVVRRASRNSGVQAPVELSSSEAPSPWAPWNDTSDLEAGRAPAVAVVPEMRCSQGHDFCYYHSNAHPMGHGECEAYARREAKEQKLALDAAGAKECPNCKILTVKSDGCNHMVCPGCAENWCWTCGQRLPGKINIGWHYNPANPMGCLQFVDLERHELRSKKTMLVRFLALPGTLLGLVVFWFTVPLWITGIGILLTLMLFIIVAVLWLPLGFLCNLMLLPFGMDGQHTEMLLCAPWASCWASTECLFGPFE